MQAPEVSDEILSSTRNYEHRSLRHSTIESDKKLAEVGWKCMTDLSLERSNSFW
jgi:hypothetical protein